MQYTILLIALQYNIHYNIDYYNIRNYRKNQFHLHNRHNRTRHLSILQKIYLIIKCLCICKKFEDAKTHRMHVVYAREYKISKVQYSV